MALLYMEGFDGFSSVSDIALAYTGNLMQFNPSAGRFGGGAFQFADVAQIFMGGNMPLEVWIGFAFQINDTHNTDCALVQFWSSRAYPEAGVSYHPVNGTIKIWNGNQNGNPLASAGVPLNDNQWHWWDIHYKNDATNGIFEVWIDGKQVINFTGNTIIFGATALTNVVFGSTSINTPRGYLDDVVICDTTGTTMNGRVGDHRIETLRPVSDAGPNNGAPSSGSTHFGVVDDTTWDASDYLTIPNASGDAEMFGFAPLSAAANAVSAVKVQHYSQKTDTGDASLETVVISAGHESDGAATPLGTAWTRYDTILTQDPATNAAWTVAAVNALQVGVKVP